MLEGPAPNLIAARRLQLAAEAGGGIGLLVLPDTNLVPPSAARSRWRMVSAVAANVEEPVWDLTLIRTSGGRPGAWTVRWDRSVRALIVDAASTAAEHRVAIGVA
jgi:protein ImuA